MNAFSLLRQTASRVPATSQFVARNFHASAAVFSAKAELAGLVQREVDEETAARFTDENLASLRQTVERNWKIVEEKAVTNMYLKDSKVRVSFHCQDVIESEEDDEGYESEAPIRFCITTTTAGKTLIMSCVSDNAELKLEAVKTTSSPAEDIHAKNGDLTDDAQYEGPEFVELAEDLQEAFFTYIEEDCAVDKDLLEYIEASTTAKEEELYLQFLKDIKLILS